MDTDLARKFLGVLVVLGGVGLSSPTRADVWESHEAWSEGWEHKYSEWFQSEALHKRIFVEKNSPYFGIQADCADSAYIFRSIFSFENKLPFAIVDPKSYGNGLKSRSELSIIDQTTKAFDHISDPNKRFVAFANRIGVSTGTWSLKSLDTYPIALESLKAGDIYHYVIPKEDTTIRHTVSIKSIDDFGNFEFIYSTQAIKKSNQDYFAETHDSRIPAQNTNTRSLMVKIGQQAHHKPVGKSGGFRRFIWPRYLKSDPATYPSSWPISEAQFEKAQNLDDTQFAQLVKKLHASKDEKLSNKIERKLHNLCEQLKERVVAVKEAIDHQQKLRIQKREDLCFNYEEFDTFSTPMRDAEIKTAFEELKAELKEQDTSRLPADIAQQIKPLLEASKEGSNFCSVEIGSGISTNLAEFHQAVFSGQLSSDPNQSVAIRWGLGGKASKTCKIYYK